MPDAPASTTLSLGLGKWNDGANPGAAPLNDNWDLIDAAIMASGQDEFPETYQEGKLFCRTDEGIIYQNIGTEEAPDFSPIIDVSTLAAAVASKAEQASLDAVQAELDALEAAIVAAEYIQADGSVSMEDDLDMGNNEVTNAANGTQPDSLVTLAQLESAVAAATGLLGTKVAGKMTRSTIQHLGAGGGYVEFDAEEINDGGVCNVAGAPAEYKATQDGRYLITFFAQTNVLQAAVAVRKNGNEIFTSTALWSTNSFGFTGGAPVVAQFFDLLENDIIKFFLYSVDGTGAVDVQMLGSNGATHPAIGGIMLIAPNAVGGGDLKSTGEVAMSADFDLGNNEAINAADATDPTSLTTLQQVEAIADDLQTQIDAVTEGQLGGDEVELVGGDQAYSGTSWVDVTGSALAPLVLAGSKFVIIDAEGSIGEDFLHRGNGQIAIKIVKDGGAPSYVKGTWCWGGGVGYYLNCPSTASKKATFTAGSYVFSLAVRQIEVTGASNLLLKNSERPARLSYALTNG